MEIDYLPLIVLTSILLGLIFGYYLQKLKIDFPLIQSCSLDSDCSWVITNCCPEKAGAKWECVNLKVYKPKECPEQVICPQVISPKPKKACICKEGSCVVEVKS